ncbi:MAG: exodeoxyribonuclease V subunit alpha [Endozoicomonadaceae bacterium]|nr:exodeoxyribonuclease V subunit alpha [Endozoicomonadaceae bacterium]
MLNALASLVDTGQIRALDYQFARFLMSLHENPLLALTGALVSYHLGHGHVCLNLDELNHDRLFDLKSDSSRQLVRLTGIEFEQWGEALKPLPVITDGRTASPLVLQDQRLYLRRYWLYERDICDWLAHSQRTPISSPAIQDTLARLFSRNYEFVHQQLVSAPATKGRDLLIKWLDIEKPEQVDWPKVEAAVQSGQLQQLDQLIPESVSLNWQKVAAAVAATQQFSVISGGPGTGKTTTVTRLLALLVEQGVTEGNVPEVRLVAPTGKAAARLTESIGSARHDLNVSDAVKQAIPAMASTIHRLLGVIPHQSNFRYHRMNRLHLDILVVDEASMIDLPMMARLLEALPDHARLILLGDRDQLSSVEAGSVLGDICGFANQGYSPEQSTQLTQLTGYDFSEFQQPQGDRLRDSLCLLRKSYRFDARSGIGQLAIAVNRGKPSQVVKFADAHYSDIRLHTSGESDYPSLMTLILDGYRPYLTAMAQKNAPETIIAAFNQFRVLCAVREGRYGISGLNQAISHTLAAAGLIQTNTLWYAGRPILITRNDHGLGLYNGDIGITLPDDTGRLRVAFEMPDRTIQSFLPSRLPDHETVFAMTVHKSQGSEFSHTVMVLPDQPSPVLTRELIYTGITRAKQQLDLFTHKAILEQAIRQATVRDSGLAIRLRSI